MADLVRKRLQRLRQQRGLTLQGLADLAQVSPSQIWNIESGLRQGDRLSLAVAKRLAVALGVSLDYFAGLTDDLRPRPRRKQSAAGMDAGAGAAP